MVREGGVQQLKESRVGLGGTEGEAGQRGVTARGWVPEGDAAHAPGTCEVSAWLLGDFAFLFLFSLGLFAREVLPVPEASTSTLGGLLCLCDFPFLSSWLSGSVCLCDRRGDGCDGGSVSDGSDGR